VNDWNNVSEFGLKGRVKICASPERTEAVAICELGEDSDSAVIFELETCDRWLLPLKSSKELGVVNYARVVMAYAL
jgi:hypothetical protein